jgi:predicted transcriptional regulator
MVLTLYSQQQYQERRSLVMSKEAVFTMKLETDLRDAFMAEAATKHVPASQIVRDLMRDYVKRERESRDYDAWYRRKVEEGLADLEAGHTYSNDEVKAHFAERRARWLAEAEAREAAR